MNFLTEPIGYSWNVMNLNSTLLTELNDDFVVIEMWQLTELFGETRMSVITSKKEAVVNSVDVICQYMDRLKMVKGNSKGLLFPALRSTSKGDSSLDKPASVLDKFKSIVN